ncbi:hypothetical protein AnigIFM60653_006731 [Aspergillus niger]|nr:hypothetical protein AnigIFM60653_006731 [Aspergillus niger]
MPTARYFAQTPPFPANAPTINLPILTFSQLQSGNPIEAEKLFAACREWGFFLLDLHDSADGRTLLHDAETMFDLDTELFSLDRSTLDQYAYNAPKDLTGYKRMGALKTDDGKLDHMHLYSITRTISWGFIRHASSALDVILTILDKQLGLERDTLSKLSPLDHESETSVRLLCSPPHTFGDAEHDRISLGGHTDIGTLTLLFHVIGGLQILPTGLENNMENWRFVKPLPGCALVNIGDTLVEWTGQLLRSSLHRVLAAPGEQAFVPRRSVAYLVRPTKSASMRRIRGGKIPAVAEGDVEETSPVDEWAAWRSKQIMLGLLKPQTRGGVVDV